MGDFPGSANTLDNLQNQIHLVALLAQLGGDNYILSGCEPDGGNKVKPGAVVIGGEIFPFTGGIIQEYVDIKVVKKDLQAFNKNYPEAYTFKTAEFTAAGKNKWEDFKRIMTNKDLQKKVESIKGLEPASRIAWAGFIAKIPKDWMLCDGRTLLIADYQELYENMGTIHGGDGVTSFKLPNMGGRFGVCYTGAGDYKDIGTIGGEEYHTLIDEEIPEHDHVRDETFNKLSARAGDVSELGTPGSVDDITADKEYNVANMTPTRWQAATIKKVGENKPHENRPPFFVEGFIIKVK
ncbi:tail fiber protein [uncultured Dysgonomonas sp.]|nr:tail fiber protein [uncultured Dysgonomonas sp.]